MESELDEKIQPPVIPATTKPTKPTKITKVSKPTKLTKVAKLTKLTKVDNPTKSATAAKTVKVVKLAKPVKSVKPVEKKRVGRPPKIIIKNPVPKDGIVKKPSNADIKDKMGKYVLEMVYDCPMLFNRIFKTFQSLSVQDIYFRFEPLCIKILSKDRVEKTSIYVRLDGSKMNRYYCEKTFEIGIFPEDIQKIVKCLNSEVSKISFTSTKRDFEETLYIVFKNDRLSRTSCHEVSVNVAPEEDWSVKEVMKLEKLYPIKFMMDSKDFKNSVTQCNLFGDIITFEKNGLKPFSWRNNYSNGRGNYVEIFEDPIKIGLISTIDEDELFSCSVHIEHIKYISSSLISNKVNISLAKDNKIIFTYKLDQQKDEGGKFVEGSEVGFIKFFTEIIDLKTQ